MSTNLPSRSVPFTDSKGCISPIWHEFLRSFVSASVDGTVATSGTVSTVTAGNGLTGTTSGTTTTLTVGQGNGMAVNADDVSVDIASQVEITAALDDELLISDKSDNNAIRKTTVRNVMELSAPGGSDTYVQYNDNGIFGGDSGLTYDGAGTLSVNTIAATTSNGNFTIANNGTGIAVVTGTNPVIAGSAGSSTTRNISFAGNTVQLTGLASTTFISGSATGWTIQTGSGKTVNYSSNGDVAIAGLYLKRSYEATRTASTTQTQGNGALTNDYNLVTTVANANDTVTLPSAAAGQYCVVCNAGANVLQVFPASGDDLGEGSNTATFINPGAFAAWIVFDGTTWRQIGGLMMNKVKSGLTASTTQTQGQMPLTADVNEFSTVANANDATTMPSAPSYSRSVKIINNGAQTLQIFPASGDNLGAGVDTSVTLASGANVCYTNYSDTNWEAI